MKIEKLKLTNYRNYDKLEISFKDTLNIIYGNNGSGKSNLVESIYLLALTKSFRTGSDVTLIKKGTEMSTIEGTILTNEKTKYKLELSKEGKKVYIDSDPVKKISDYVSNINIVMFNPLDTRIISESPAFRRKYLDIEISQLNKEYLLLLNGYNKILKNRNAYLKQMYLNGNSSKEYLDILTKKLIEFGIQIYNIRKDFIDNINEYISQIYINIFETGTLSVKYKSTFANKEEKDILEMYQKNYRKEMEYGKTLYGIHHDDFDLLLDGNLIRDYGSVGQQKNSIISLKMAEIVIFKKFKDEYPILILDDLFSELDKDKINNIIAMLNRDVQTFITTTDIVHVDKKLLESASLFEIKENNIESRDLNEK